jgi:hypothetical protein
VFYRAAERLPEGAPDPDRALNPYAIGLSPDRWEQDGLFADPGLTLDQAREQVPGVDTIWIDDLVGVVQAVPQPSGPPGGGPPGPPGGGPPGPPGGGPPGPGPPPTGPA